MRNLAHILLDRIVACSRGPLSAEADAGDPEAARDLERFDKAVAQLRDILLTNLEARVAYHGLTQGLCGDDQDMEAMFGTDRRQWRAARTASAKLAKYP